MGAARPYIGQVTCQGEGALQQLKIGIPLLTIRLESKLSLSFLQSLYLVRSGLSIDF
jgi:hypothetical protein